MLKSTRLPETGGSSKLERVLFVTTATRWRIRSKYVDLRKKDAQNPCPLDGSGGPGGQEALEARRPWREEAGKAGKTVPKTPGSRVKERTCHRTHKLRREEEWADVSCKPFKAPLEALYYVKCI